MRGNVASLSVLMLLGASAFPIVGQTNPNACTLPAEKQLSSADLDATFSPSLPRYRVKVVLGPAGRKSITYSADYLIINATTAESLVRRIEKPRSDVDKLLIDARIVVIDSPLSFDRVDLSIRAESIVFGPHASSLGDWIESAEGDHSLPGGRSPHLLRGA